MQRGRRIFYAMGALLGLLAVASCRMDGGDEIKSTSTGESQNKIVGDTLVITVGVSTESQKNSTSRSAVPSPFIGADGNALVFAGALYEGDAENSVFQKGECKDGAVSLAFELPSEEAEGEKTLEIRAYKSGTDDFSNATPLLSGATVVKITGSTAELSTESIQLKPCEELEENGAVSLEILVPSEYFLSIKSEAAFSLELDDDEASAITEGGGIGNILWSRPHYPKDRMKLLSC